MTDVNGYRLDHGLHKDDTKSFIISVELAFTFWIAASFGWLLCGSGCSYSRESVYISKFFLYLEEFRCIK